MAKQLSQVSTQDILAEIKRRESKYAKLTTRRDQLQAELAQLNAEIAELGIAGAATKKAAPVVAKKKKKAVARRGKGSGMTLSTALLQVLKKDKAMSIPDIEAAVTAAGYRSKSKQFRTIIMQTLSREKAIKRVSRGMYALK